jgi:hypothetical protein
MSRRTVWIVIVVVVGLAVSYLAVNKMRRAVHRASMAKDLEDIAFAYVHYYDQHKNWPSKPEDLQPYLKAAGSLPGMKEGEYIVVWDAYPKEKVVLVYEKDAPTNGGFVCYRDAKLENLTAIEVQAALAARKK